MVLPLVPPRVGILSYPRARGLSGDRSISLTSGWFPIAVRFQLSLSPVIEIGSIDPASRLVDLICTACDLGDVPGARYT